MIELKNKSILLLEDDYILAVVLKISLRTQFQLFHATSTLTAIQILSNYKIDCMICDIELEDSQKNGVEFTKQIKANHLYQSIPIIGVSSHVNEPEYTKLFDAYFTKPADIELVYNKISTLVN